MRVGAHALELFARLDAVRVLALQTGLDELHHAGDANLEELVEVGVAIAEELHALEQRIGAVLGLLRARAD
jgi:hypothetical protein